MFMNAVRKYMSGSFVSVFCDEDEAELALGFANRSAALVHLGDHDRALIDIDQALENGYPLDLRFKLSERKAKCLSSLGRPTAEIVQACQSALLDLETGASAARLDPAKKATLDQEVHKLMEEAQSGHSGRKGMTKCLSVI